MPCLFSGVFIFGIGVALIGQTYNSHADSHMLFLVWLIPTILLSILIRYEAFYVLGIILVNLSGWLYINTHSIPTEWSSFLTMFLTNLALACIFYISEHIAKTGRYAKYIAFTCTSFYLFILSFHQDINNINLFITNLLFIAMLLGTGMYHLRYKLDVPMVYISTIFGIIYIIARYIKIIVYNFSSGILIQMIFFGFVLIAINYFIVEKINMEIKKARHE